MDWEAAAIPPKEPPTTTTSHSQVSWAVGKGDSCGLPLGRSGAIASLARLESDEALVNAEVALDELSRV